MTMTDAGEIAQGTIVIRDGRIMAIGPDVTVPAGARVVDGRGGVVTPGFLQPDNTLGAAEVSQVPASADRATPRRPINAGFEFPLGSTPDSILLPVSPLAGLTTPVHTPPPR